MVDHVVRQQPLERRCVIRQRVADREKPKNEFTIDHSRVTFWAAVEPKPGFVLDEFMEEIIQFTTVYAVADLLRV